MNSPGSFYHWPMNRCSGKVFDVHIWSSSRRPWNQLNEVNHLNHLEPLAKSRLVWFFSGADRSRPSPPFGAFRGVCPFPCDPPLHVQRGCIIKTRSKSMNSVLRPDHPRHTLPVSSTSLDGYAVGVRQVIPNAPSGREKILRSPRQFCMLEPRCTIWALTPIRNMYRVRGDKRRTHTYTQRAAAVVYSNSMTGFSIHLAEST